MIIEYNHKDKNKDFSDFKNETFVDLFFKLYIFQNCNPLLSKFEIFQIECKVTGILKKLLESCNKNVFSNFNLELRMEDVEDAY